MERNTVLRFYLYGFLKTRLDEGHIFQKTIRMVLRFYGFLKTRLDRALGVHILEQAEVRETLRQTTVADKYKNDEILYIKSCKKADVAIEKNTHQSDDISKWNRNHILDLIRPLKISGDKAMPPNKPELYQMYLETRHRERRVVDWAVEKEYEESLLVMDDFDMDDNDEVSVES